MKLIGTIIGTTLVFFAAAAAAQNAGGNSAGGYGIDGAVGVGPGAAGTGGKETNGHAALNSFGVHSAKGSQTATRSTHGTSALQSNSPPSTGKKIPPTAKDGTGATYPAK